MNTYSVITTNEDKFRTAQKVCAEFGVKLEQVAGYDIDEIQGEDAKKIVARKAADAYALVQKPVIVTDDSWIIPALGGFPGAYMKSMNEWFTIDDWLRLLAGITDRRVVLSQLVAYQDEHEQVIFAVDVEGILLEQPQGDSKKTPPMALASFDGGKTTVAENMAAGSSSTAHLPTAWHELGKWLQARQD
ncbi:MAG TPA: non-canonical purine NTP pyrophosphatase [Candidatus Saccharimonadales bacterium]|nr:non-canonical purine NTP pyrophosphatase [Candidatus Saccharimonadales bacterium]